jgi:hypothetical protein
MWSILDRRKRADRAAATAALDADESEAGVWEARIGADLADSGALDDEAVLAAAGRLLALAAPAAAKQFHINVDTNYGAVGEFSAPVTFHQGPPVPPAPPAAR